MKKIKEIEYTLQMLKYKNDSIKNLDVDILVKIRFLYVDNTKSSLIKYLFRNYKYKLLNYPDGPKYNQSNDFIYSNEQFHKNILKFYKKVCKLKEKFTADVLIDKLIE